MLKKENFQAIVSGKKTELLFIENNNIKATLSNYGARVVSLHVLNDQSVFVDVNLGFDNIEKYLVAEDQCYGAVVGRYAGRIANGKFYIDGKQINLVVNNGSNAIHGGNHGFQTRVWEIDKIGQSKITFSYVSADGEEGYPGKMTIKVTYELTEKRELIIGFEYSTSKKTIANIINHNFWNLNGNGHIDNHFLKIIGSKYNAIDINCIPTHIAKVENTPFDFRTFSKIGTHINKSDVQLIFGSGYDHTFVLDKSCDSNLELAAVVIGEISKIGMEVYTTEPGVHFYTGNFMQGLNTLKSGIKDCRRTAFCLETQHFPNSPNNPSAPSTIKEQDKIYNSKTIYKFFIDNELNK